MNKLSLTAIENGYHLMNYLGNLFRSMGLNKQQVLALFEVTIPNDDTVQPSAGAGNSVSADPHDDADQTTFDEALERFNKAFETFQAVVKNDVVNLAQRTDENEHSYSPGDKVIKSELPGVHKTRFATDLAVVKHEEKTNWQPEVGVFHSKSTSKSRKYDDHLSPSKNYQLSDVHEGKQPHQSRSMLNDDRRDSNSTTFCDENRKMYDKPRHTQTFCYEQSGSYNRKAESHINETLLMRHLSYDGVTKSFRAFKTAFDRLNKHYCWSEDYAKDILHVSLYGKASEFLVSMNTEDRTVAEIMEDLEKRFAGRTSRNTSIQAFHREMQGINESLEDWGDRVTSLAWVAFEGVPDYIKDREAVVRFCSGCLDQDAGSYTLLRGDVHSIPDAIQWMTQYRCVKRVDEQHGQSDQDEDDEYSN